MSIPTVRREQKHLWWSETSVRQPATGRARENFDGIEGREMLSVPEMTGASGVSDEEESFVVRRGM